MGKSRERRFQTQRAQRLAQRFTENHLQFLRALRKTSASSALNSGRYLGQGLGTLAWLILVLLLLAADAGAALQSLDARRYLLRSGNAPEWQEFEGKTPHGSRLDLRFMTQKNPVEATLFIRQSDVKQEWPVELNGRKIGKLFLMEAALVHAMPIPVNGLRDGENILSILPPKDNDDIVVGEVQLDTRPIQQALGQSFIEIRVLDANEGKELPCRLTIADREGALAAVHADTNRSLAVRPGVIYTGNGKVRFGLLPGDYTLYASRGFEYSLATNEVSVTNGQTSKVEMRIHREVPTRGLVSCDTHIHTFTHAQHGDATIEERVLTLAGEGIELPISTEHNLLVDLSEPARPVGVDGYFTPVVGAEVTTKSGHFNAFPVEIGSRVPEFRIEHWPKLMENIRATPGVQVIVLNHPRDVHTGFCPFAETNFNAVTGENLRGFEFGFDAVELINSGALRSDLMQVYRDWFALLNYGYRITGVGASDSHDVSRFIVGQGRTYIACADENPAKLNLAQACNNLRHGRAVVSLGLLTQMNVDGRFTVGNLATNLEETVRVTVIVSGPSWTSADRVELFANGVKIREQRIQATTEVEKARITWTIPRPTHDVHLVAISSGPGITSPHWAIPRPYQPSSLAWKPRVFGSTNPIWVDADGDGKFTCARAYAKSLIERVGNEPSKLLAALAKYDSAVAAQAANLCQAAGRDVRKPEFATLLANSAEAVRHGFEAFRATLSSH